MAQIQDLLTTPQSVTASWADVGGEIQTDGWNDIGFYTKITINDSQNLQFRILAKHTSGHADEYEILGATYSAGKNTVDPMIYEINSDSDQKVFYHLPLLGEIPSIQIQVKALTVGSTAAKVDEIKYDLI